MGKDVSFGPETLDLPGLPREGEKENWQQYLRDLHFSIWKTHRNPLSRNPIERGWASETRRLTNEEWALVQEIILEHKPICYLHNACWGFGCGMALYEEPPLVYPNTLVKPDILIDITKEHLPIPKREAGSTELDDRTSFQDGWNAFSPYTHNEENTKLLVFHGFGKPKPASHYDY